MKHFSRTNTAFSLCGLNCALCTMYLDHYCPGCGGGAGNQSCKIAKCSIAHGQIEYCYECGEYPCSYYQGIDEFDSFITHRNQLKDLDKARHLGPERYLTQLREKADILNTLLQHYNAGRQKSFYCLAVNLLELNNVREVMLQIRQEADLQDMPLKDRAAVVMKLFQDAARQQGIVLKLNKVPKKKKGVSVND